MARSNSCTSSSRTARLYSNRPADCDAGVGEGVGSGVAVGAGVGDGTGVAVGSGVMVSSGVGTAVAVAVGRTAVGAGAIVGCASGSELEQAAKRRTKVGRATRINRDFRADSCNNLASLGI